MLTDKHADKRETVEVCERCRFWFGTPRGNYGDCRRNPPNGRHEGFPTANPDDWCGEFKPDEHKIAEIEAANKSQEQEK